MHKIWVQVRSSLWFVPGVLVIGAIILALGLIQVDVTFAEFLRSKSWEPLLNTGADGARGMLTAIASSMITVAGVAFSVTIVTLSLASSQYTPRILRNFMRDRANQSVLGVFVAVFAYCLIVLRTIRADDDNTGFVPLLAVGFAVLLALVSIGFLIFFIHHVAASIQASSILDSISEETLGAVDRLFPQEMGEEETDVLASETIWHADWHEIPADRNGYVQHIDSEGLMHFAEKHDLTIRLERHPGDFIVQGAALVCTNRTVDEHAAHCIRALFVIGTFRTVEQDTGFGIRQIVDIVMKALSPGINDTSTAVSALDYLSAILCRLAGRRFEAAFRAEHGKVRVIASSPTFHELVALAFDEVRLSASGNVTILIHMLCIIRRVAAATENEQRRDVLLRHALLIHNLADHSVPVPYDRARINHEMAAVRETMRLNVDTLPPLASASSAGAGN